MRIIAWIEQEEIVKKVLKLYLYLSFQTSKISQRAHRHILIWFFLDTQASFPYTLPVRKQVLIKNYKEGGAS